MPAALAAPTAPPRSALLLFTPAGERALAGVPGLSLGIVSAAQGSYTPEQFLLDITQGARIANTAYPEPRPPALSVLPQGTAQARVAGWGAARERAERAPQLLEPGLLASSVPGGAAYAGVTREAHLDALAAAGRRGRISMFSLGPASTLTARIAALRRARRLVVADLPAGGAGEALLHSLVAGRETGELVIVLQRASARTGSALTWGAAAGVGARGATDLSSRTTQQRGLVASIDIAPAILARLALHVPADMRGAPLRGDGPLDAPALRSLKARLGVIGGRRLRALAFLLCAWALALLACARSPRGRARALRVGALAFMWTPAASLVPAAIAPAAWAEYALIVALCFALGALADALVPWPRAPLVPALAAIAAIAADALGHAQLLARSLLGPDPALGARFYGIGNELKSGLAVLVLAAVAAVLYPAARSRRSAGVFACAGAALALVEGSARIGAGVGGVILVCAGFALAAVLMLPGALTRRRALAIAAAPLAGLAALALLDIATAHGSGHFTGSILHARSPGDVRDVIVRRYEAAWAELHNHAMPYAAGVALAAAAAAIARRRALLAPLRGDPAFAAALAGGLAAGVAGALVEDSGPLLLVVAVFALGCVASYTWGREPGAPRPRPQVPRESPLRRAVPAGAVQHDLVL